MADFWFAECLPCKWEEKHTDQDSAIHAAEEHVFLNHRHVPPEVRGAKFMGHVQNRTETSPGPAPETSPDPLDLAPVISIGDGGDF